jgi:hypothetical protein
MEKNEKLFKEIKYQIEKLQIAYGNDKPKVTQLIAEFMHGMIKDYEEANEDKNRLVREIDVILCGKDAAKQASLCDLVNPIRELKENYDKLKKENAAFKQAIGVNNIVVKELYEAFQGSFLQEAKETTETLIKTNEILLGDGE